MDLSHRVLTLQQNKDIMILVGAEPIEGEASPYLITEFPKTDFFQLCFFQYRRQTWNLPSHLDT